MKEQDMEVHGISRAESERRAESGRGMGHGADESVVRAWAWVYKARGNGARRRVAIDLDERSSNHTLCTYLVERLNHWLTRLLLTSFLLVCVLKWLMTRYKTSICSTKYTHSLSHSPTLPLTHSLSTEGADLDKMSGRSTTRPDTSMLETSGVPSISPRCHACLSCFNCHMAGPQHPACTWTSGAV